MKHGLPKIKDMEPGDFKNNDYLLRMAEKLNRDGRVSYWARWMI